MSPFDWRGVCDRLVVLASEAVDALHVDEVDRFQALTGEREGLYARLLTALAASPPTTTALEPLYAVAEADRALERAVVHSLGETRAALAALGRGRSALGGYAAGPSGQPSRFVDQAL